MKTASTEPLIGVINAGSSSVKFSFYEGEQRILTDGNLAKGSLNSK